MDEAKAHYPDSETSAAGRKDFIAVIVHQLRTPLSVIKFVAEELSGNAGANLTESQRKKLQSILEADERALNLVNNFLSASALFGEGVKLELADCDLRRAFEQIADALRPMAAVKNQRIIFDAPHDMTPVRVCNEYLNRAFQNILDNAICYGNENSEVLVTVREHDGAYVVSVHDVGPAIPEEEFGNMFQKFHRLPEAEKMKPSGSGLGLFIAKAAVELNGGRIWIESREGKGTTFYFTVPIGKR